jgi:alpha-amylase/alpha-mannosidase (GH57 family)
MHQPYYVDPATRSATMPWVRLHCARSYLDMIALLADYPGVRANFNLSPALVLQVRELLDGRIRDEWLDLSRKPAAALDEDERFLVLENFFKANWDHLVRPHPRYWELLNKRGLTLYRDDVRRGVRYFTTQELLDLQVWFNLTWCGFTACRLHPELVELKRKERGFTEAEKQRVLDIHLELMRLVLQRYREAEERGQVELMTSPYFHPILPLLCDTASAERAMPGRPMPRRFAWPDDAAAQITTAIEQHAAVFGSAPVGLWPAEGSVSPEIIPLMQRAGIEYFCTDEEILFASLRGDPAWRGRSVDHLELFQGWRIRNDGAAVNAVFRERPLSDFIGFSAVKHEPAQAAMHLLFHLRHIGDLTNTRGIIPLMLDGENAWEHFRDGGEAFLRALYDGLQSDGARLRCTTIADYLRAHPPQRECSSLHSGSWIGANFDVWIGEPEENRAWDLLGETRTWLERHNTSLTPFQLAEARKAMLAAEGSDWFWWYGPDFSTENDPLFDRLFRAHLRAVYEACGAVPPAALESPVSQRAASSLYTAPSRFITPIINGRRAGFFEWSGAGHYDSATRNGGIVSRVFFGNDATHFYLRIDFARLDPVTIDVRFQSPEGLIVHVPSLAAPGIAVLAITAPDGTARPAGSVALGEILEFSLPLESLTLRPGAPVSFQLTVGPEQHPPHSAIEFALLGDEWALENWVV